MDNNTPKSQSHAVLWLMGVIIALVVGGIFASRHASAGLSAFNNSANKTAPAGSPVNLNNSSAWSGLQTQLKLTPAQDTQLKPIVEDYLNRWSDHRKAYAQKAREVLMSARPTPAVVPPGASPQAGKPRMQVGGGIKLTPELKGKLGELRVQFRKDAEVDRKAMVAKTTSFLAADQQQTLDRLLSNPRYTYMLVRGSGRGLSVNQMVMPRSNRMTMPRMPGVTQPRVAQPGITTGAPVPNPNNNGPAATTAPPAQNK